MKRTGGRNEGRTPCVRSRPDRDANCDAVGNDFHESLFGRMIHANVFASEDMGTIFVETTGTVRTSQSAQILRLSL